MRYLFKHVLMREVVYDMQMRRHLRRMHRKAAETIELRYGDDLAPHFADLAYHYGRAEVVERERHYAKLAGERAAAQYANEEAVGYLGRALELTPDDDLFERYALLLAREKVYGLLGKRKTQTQDLEALETLADILDDDQRRARVALRRAAYHIAVSDYPAAIEAARASVDWATQANERSVEAGGYLSWGRALWLQGNYALAREHYQQALELAQAAQDRRGEADGFYNLGIIQYDLNNYLAARELQLSALDIYRSLDDREREASVLNSLAITWGGLGEPALERDYHERALAIRREIGNRQGEAQSLYNLSVHYYDVGDREAARWYCSEALGITREVGDLRVEAYVLTYLGLILEGLHAPEPTFPTDLATAKTAYAQALAIRRKIGQPALSVDSLAGLARVELAQAHPVRALEHVEEILAWIDERGVTGIGDDLLVYMTVCRVLQANQDPRTRQALNTAHVLVQERAARLPDRDARRFFLEENAVHREIVTQWRAMHKDEQ